MLGFNFSLKDQLTFYGSYHSKPLNQLVHFIFVPLILWSAAVWLAYIPTPPALHVGSHLDFLPAVLGRAIIFNVAFWVLLAYDLYYILLEPCAGLSWGIFQAIPSWITATLFQQHVPLAWAWAIGLHVLSWVFQVHIGHVLIEHRKPALLDSFFQSLVLAPLFAWFEGLFFLGYRPQLQKELEEAVRANLENIGSSEEQKAKLLHDQGPQ